MSLACSDVIELIPVFINWPASFCSSQTHQNVERLFKLIISHPLPLFKAFIERIFGIFFPIKNSPGLLRISLRSGINPENHFWGLGIVSVFCYTPLLDMQPTICAYP